MLLHCAPVRTVEVVSGNGTKRVNKERWPFATGSQSNNDLDGLGWMGATAANTVENRRRIHYGYIVRHTGA